MSISEYIKLENSLKTEYEYNLHMLRLDYVEQNKKYSVGQFLYNSTGIIKVNYANYTILNNQLEIVYFGYKYKKIKNQLVRTKDIKICGMCESHNLKLI